MTQRPLSVRVFVESEPLPLSDLDALPWPSNQGIHSTISYVDQLPRRRHWSTTLGKLLFLPRTGMVVVPYELYTLGAYVAVVRGTDTYPVGGYNLCVGDAELETSMEVAL